MEKHIFDAMNDDIIKVAAPKYGVSFEQIKRLGGFENFIYEFTDKGNDYVLRFVHSNHRTFEQVYAELEFIDYLDKNDCAVSTVMHSENDNLVEVIEIDKNNYFTIVEYLYDSQNIMTLQ